MATMLEYKCPSCGGALSFDSQIQTVKCPYCDTEFDMEAMKELDEVSVHRKSRHRNSHGC